jgi:hypothetical protein
MRTCKGNGLGMSGGFLTLADGHALNGAPSGARNRPTPAEINAKIGTTPYRINQPEHRQRVFDEEKTALEETFLPAPPAPEGPVVYPAYPDVILMDVMTYWLMTMGHLTGNLVRYMQNNPPPQQQQQQPDGELQSMMPKYTAYTASLNGILQTKQQMSTQWGQGLSAEDDAALKTRFRAEIMPAMQDPNSPFNRVYADLTRDIYAGRIPREGVLEMCNVAIDAAVRHLNMKMPSGAMGDIFPLFKSLADNVQIIDLNPPGSPRQRAHLRYMLDDSIKILNTLFALQYLNGSLTSRGM